MNGPADLPRASQKQGPAALTGGLRPLPLPLQPKTGRLPGGATAAWELIGCPTQGHRSLPCLVCELPLVNFSWQGRPSRPHLPNPSPCPQLAAPHARKGGTNSNCLLQKRAFDKCPHPPSGGKTSSPPKFLGSASLSPHFRLHPGLKKGTVPRSKVLASRPNCNLIPTRLAQAKSPGFLGETDKQQHQDSGK